MRFLVVTLSIATLVAAGPPTETGLKLVVRERTPGWTDERVEYLRSDRKRVEIRIASRVQAAILTRCDLNKEYVLDLDARTYSERAVPAYPGKPVLLFASIAAARRPPKAPTLVIETTTVDTGERKVAFGHTARRVLTTRNRIPLDGAPRDNDVAHTDGWYIDLDTRISCDPEAGVRTFVLGTLSQATAGDRTPPVVTFKDVGTPERGYPLHLKTTTRNTITLPDGTARTHSFATESVADVFTEPLDDSLFDVPRGFRPAEGRWVSMVHEWMAAWLRLGSFLVQSFW